MGEADGMNLILIDLYVPTLTPRLHCSDDVLQLPDDITFFAVCGPLEFQEYHLCTCYTG